ncbi:hypothetical protein KKG31_02695 [Patescibacteria group bacterium]|nr:hypothetical protein [Patescibacteria group bacterium]MBU1758070.1 hypothetical protein [Patescibacteria group bacterium]
MLIQSKDAITKAQELDKVKEKKDKTAEEILADQERITKAQENHEKQVETIFSTIFSHKIDGDVSLYNKLIENLNTNANQYPQLLEKENIKSYLVQLMASGDVNIYTKDDGDLKKAITYLEK